MPKTRKPSAAQEARDNELTAAVTYVLAHRPLLAADAPAYRRRGRRSWLDVKTTTDLELAPDTIEGAESAAQDAAAAPARTLKADAALTGAPTARATRREDELEAATFTERS